MVAILLKYCKSFILYIIIAEFWIQQGLIDLKREINVKNFSNTEETRKVRNITFFIDYFMTIDQERVLT